MKKRLMIFILSVVVLLSCASCTSEVQSWSAMDSYMQVTAPRYKKYVLEDKNLADDEKTAVIKATDEAIKLIKEHTNAGAK